MGWLKNASSPTAGQSTWVWPSLRPDSTWQSASVSLFSILTLTHDLILSTLRLSGVPTCRKEQILRSLSPEWSDQWCEPRPSQMSQTRVTHHMPVTHLSGLWLLHPDKLNMSRQFSPVYNKFSRYRDMHKLVGWRAFMFNGIALYDNYGFMVTCLLYYLQKYLLLSFLRQF